MQEGVGEQCMNFPDKKYKIIYADPPWFYHSTDHPNDRGVQRGVQGQASMLYETIETEDLMKLPVSNIADTDCMMFMWVTSPCMPDGLKLMKAWGFDYKMIAFVWEKTNQPMGLGNYTRTNHEFVLLGRKGKFVRASNRVKQSIKSPLTQHSKKPQQVRDRIIELCGDVPRIELFARTKIHGWDTWGNDEKLENQPLENFYR